MQLRGSVIAIVLLAWLRTSSAEPETPTRKLVVGTKPLAPFIIKKPDGTWAGISIDLVRRVAEEMHATIEVRELSLEELLAAKNPEIDITASVNVTVNTDAKWDLSHAFYSTGLAIAVLDQGKESRWEVVKRVFSGPFLWLLAGTLLLLFTVGFLSWWVEKRPVEEVPKEKALLSKSLFWAFEPVTRYKSSQHASRAGRIIGLVWGMFGVVFISTMTANLSSQLTVHQLQSPIKGPDDLVRKKIGTVTKSAGAKYCERHNFRTTVYDDPGAALTALERGDVEAVVYEAPILQYLAETTHKGTRVLPGTFSNHGYAFGLRRDTPIRREFNKALLSVTASEAWRSVMRSYLGSTE